MLCGWFLVRRSQRNHAASAGNQLGETIQRRDLEGMRSLVQAPAFLNDRSQPERDLLTLNLLEGEVSPEGLAILTKDGDFGPLRSIFPSEAESWSKALAVNAEECVAFRLQKGGFTAELVLHRQADDTYRVLRCNDIRQLAQSSPP
ncbi:MAG: hypothetical protein JWR15_2866 [Prosthecobacter sp.]|nr:hypothetical protein [Prosthecobacter sp.]